MKPKNLLLICMALCLGLTAYGQCPNSNAVSPFNPDLTPSGIGYANRDSYTCAWGGDYFYASVTAGHTINFSTCNTTTGVDVYMTLYNHGSGAYLTHNDNNCGVYSSITWVAPMNMQVRIVLDEGAACSHGSTCMVIEVWDDGILPVELSSFEGKSEGVGNRLFWETTVEVGVDHFRIEREDMDGNFQPLGELEPLGGQEKAAHYEFLDARPMAGTNVYRLVELTTDGTQEVLGQVEVMRQSEGLSQLAVSPNPVQDRIRIQANAQEGEAARVILTDLMGRNVLETKPSLSAGVLDAELDLSSLEAGVYLLRVEQGGTALTERIVKQ